MKRYKLLLTDILSKLQIFLMTDRMQHFIWAYFFASVMLFFVQMKVIWVITLALSLIAGKEYLVDKVLKGGQVSKKDMIFGVAGTVFSLFVYFFNMA